MAAERGNPRALVGAGVVAGMVQVAAGVAMYLAGVYFKPWSMLVSVAVLLVCIVAGTRWYAARYHGNEISYSQAFVAGVVISVATGAVYAIYNVVSITWLYPNFLDELVRARIGQVAASQPTPPSFEAMRAGVSTGSLAMGNLVRLSVIGTVFSAGRAFFLRTRQPDAPLAPSPAP